MFTALDTDHTGTIEINEFYASMMDLLEPSSQADLAERSFKAMDKDGNGVLDRQELHDVLMQVRTAACVL